MHEGKEVEKWTQEGKRKKNDAHRKERRGGSEDSSEGRKIKGRVTVVHWVREGRMVRRSKKKKAENAREGRWSD